MIRPLVYILSYLLLGIVFGQQFYEYKFVALFLIITIGSAIALSIIKKLPSSMLLAIIAISGFIIGNNSLEPTDIKIHNLASKGEKYSINCQIIDLSKEYSNTYKYIVKLNSVNGIKCSSKAILYTVKDFETGDNIKINDKLKIINKNINPTDFDSHSYYKSYGIEYKIYSENIRFINHSTNFNSIVKSIRNYFENIYDLILPAKESSFVKAVVLGDKANLDENLYNTFRDAGIAHVLAISGIHISILAEIILYLLRKKRNTAYIITIFFLIFYCIFTGMSPSVVRAVLMTLIIIAGQYIGRDYDIISSASLSCIIMLIINPYNIYNSGFCYSYICVFGIGIMIDVISKYKIQNLKYGKLITSILISLMANIAAKPYTIYEYYYINLYDIITNMLVVPFMSITLSLSILSGLAGSVNIYLGRFLSGLPYILINYYENICSLFNNLPYYKINVGGISVVTLVLIYLAIILFYNLIIKFIKTKYLTIIILIFMLLGINHFVFANNNIEFIDTDKINTIIIKDKECILVNFGSKPKSKYGEYRVLNYLKYKNTDQINKVYITKTDYYHIGGLFETKDKIKIDKIYILKTCKRNDMYERLLTTANDNKTVIEYVDENDIVYKNIKVKDTIKLVEKQ